jgi:hypothetical protein
MSVCLYATAHALLVGYKKPVRHGYPWRTRCTPQVDLYQWRVIPGVQQYATDSQILYATDELFPSSACLLLHILLDW